MWVRSLLLGAVLVFPATQGLGQAAPSPSYTPSFDLGSIDKEISPCEDLYHYACGGWQKNPIPRDQVSRDVTSKMEEDNLQLLRGILEEASRSGEGQLDHKPQLFPAACVSERSQCENTVASERRVDGSQEINSTQAVRYSALPPTFEADAMAAMIVREPPGEDKVPDLILMKTGLRSPSSLKGVRGEASVCRPAR